MRALRAWGENRYMPMVMLAQIVALCAEDCHELIQLSRKKSLLACPDAGGITLKDWLQQYRRPTSLRGAMLHLLQSPEDLSCIETTKTQVKVIRRSLMDRLRRRIHTTFTKGRNKRLETLVNRWLDRYYEQVHLPMLTAMIRDDELIADNFREWIALPEFAFYFSVVMPCWLEYHTTPWKLYRQASEGHLESLEKLLRLDPQVASEERIARALFTINKRNLQCYQMLQRAGVEGRKKPITLTDVKFLLGGLLLKVSIECEELLNGNALFPIYERYVVPQRRAEFDQWVNRVKAYALRHPVRCALSSPDVKALFDAVHEDSGLGLFDPAFNMQPNSFYKRLDRNAKLWPSLQKEDKRRAA